MSDLWDPYKRRRIALIRPVKRKEKFPSFAKKKYAENVNN